jgi:hypothetical protein
MWTLGPPKRLFCEKKIEQDFRWARFVDIPKIFKPLNDQQWQKDIKAEESHDEESTDESWFLSQSSDSDEKSPWGEDATRLSLSSSHSKKL